MNKRPTSLHFSLITVCLIVFALGFIMIFGTSSAQALDRSTPAAAYDIVFKHLLYALVSLVLSAIIYIKGAPFWIKHSRLILFGLSFLLVLTLIPGIGRQINGARRWLHFGFITFQPSEFMKIAIPFHFFYAYHNCKEFKFKNFAKILAMYAVPLGLILLEPDNGTVFFLLTSLAALFFIANVPLLYWAVPLAGIAVLGSIVAMQMPHVMRRIEIYINPEADILGKGHQPYQAKIATGSGGLWGVGLGKSLQKMDYLPEARNDYIGAIFAEEFGFFGILLLIGCYAMIAILGMQLAMRCKNALYSQVISSQVFLIVFQAFLNLGVVCGLLPSKGMNLPFFSQGGSCLIANCCMIALALSASVADSNAQFVKANRAPEK